MAEPERDPVLGEPPPAKRRDVDPIEPTKHPWNLPERLELPHCSCNPEERYVVIPREANLPIDAEARRVVARVSLAVVAVASIDADGDQLWKASGFIVEFDEASMTGKIFSSATVARHDSFYPDIEKIKVYLFDGASYDATIIACDYHWNLLLLSVSFDRFVKTMKLVEISENRNARDPRLERFSLLPQLARENLYPGDTIIGLGRRPQETFGLQANCGLYRKYCRPTIRVLGVNLHNAQSSPWVEVPTTLHGGLDGILVELPDLCGNNTGDVHLYNYIIFPNSYYLDAVSYKASRAALSIGLRQKDLIIQCNKRCVATSLQLFEILVENVGKMVELTVIRAEDGTTHSIYLPVEEAVEENFYL
ncbi:hypothetical protein BAE44_0002015 [Dichanthelium oligosanthes]|uniref:PDZ domain-containing protein n=1 Tax=Dichanthelium oligosanthes TaxID=888268 RepID=A0A1E5WHU1_9POAL|nr:hypothetical protein BAE44_0002015 [Dichanthelium oligosanthes]